MHARSYTLEADLIDCPGVSRTLVIGSEQTLAALHELLRAAFDWHDDHLYSFWLDGEFWGEDAYTSPVEAEPDAKTADVPLDQLGPEPGQRIAYLFDFGDEWRVLLTVTDARPNGGAQPEIVERRGEAPPQYDHEPRGGLGEIAPE
jgi:pRiA4b ORF-3-like protein